MTSGARRLLAAGVLALTWPPALASVVIAWAFELPESPVPRVFLSTARPEVVSRFDEIGVTVALIYGALSALLLVRRPHPVAAILAVHAVGSAVAAFGVQWGLLGERVDGLWLWSPIAHAAGWGYIPGTFATTIVPLLVVSRVPRPLARVIVPLGLANAVAATAVAIVNQAPGLPPQPFGSADAALQAALPTAYQSLAYVAVLVSCLVTAVLAIVWRSAPALARPRLGWLLAGHGFLTVSYGALVVPASVAVPEAVWSFGTVAPALGQVFYPAAVLVIVLGRRLEGIDQAVSTVLTSAVLAFVAATLFVAMHAALAALWPSAGAVLGLVAAAIVATALPPARPWIRSHVERLVYPAGDGPAELVRRLGGRVGDVETGAAGLRALADGLRIAFRLDAVWVARAGVDGVGATRPDDLELPLMAEGRRIGALVARPRPGERIPKRTRRQLEELVLPLAVVLQLADANDGLERARAAVVAARHDERRTLRRELHDGIGPALAGGVYAVAAIENLADADPVAAGLLASRIAADLRERVDEVVAVADGLEPDATERDLAAALRDLVAGFRDAGPRLELELDASVAVPPARRRTVLLVAAEAVLNAIRHADATRIRVRLGAEPRGPGAAVAVLEVADDGVGIPDGAAPGVGSASMRERAVAAGGSFAVRSRPGEGTVVRLELPATAVARPEESV